MLKTYIILNTQLFFIRSMGIVRRQQGEPLQPKETSGPSFCSINMSSRSALPKFMPLLLDESGEWVISNGTTTEKEIRMTKGQGFMLDCTSSGQLQFLSGETSHVQARCLGNSTFVVKGETKALNFKELGCLKKVQSYLELLGCCGDNQEFTKYGIGFNISTGFKTLIVVCMDTENLTTLWTSYNLSYEIDTATYGRRPWFSYTKSIFRFRVFELYKSNVTRNIFARLLGSDKLARSYIQKDGIFLSRGHLTARSDFIFHALQDATFWFSNLAPQWSDFNSQNWNSLEIGVHNFAVALNKSLVVYTGTYGVLTLNDVNGNPVDIYLKEENGQKMVPVPLLFWKGVFDPEDGKGTVYLGVNDVFVSEKNLSALGYLLCHPLQHDPILRNIPTANLTNLGYLYACEICSVKDLLLAFPHEYDKYTIFT